MEWIKCTDRPLAIFDGSGRFQITEDGDRLFLAAVPYSHRDFPSRTFWWIAPCVITESGLMISLDGDEPEDSGWEIEAVTHWMPMPNFPTPLA